MQYVKVARAEELPQGGKLKASVKDKTLLLTNVGGAYYTIDNKCTHMGGSLFDGKLEGDAIACPRHKTVFNVKTGKVIANGAIAFIHLKVRDTQAYPVKEDNGDLLVGI